MSMIVPIARSNDSRNNATSKNLDPVGHRPQNNVLSLSNGVLGNTNLSIILEREKYPLHVRVGRHIVTNLE
jgi:hypothetical protein